MPLLALNFKNTVADTQQTLYTSPATGSGTRIDSLTAANNSSVNASYELYIDSGIGDNVPIIPLRVVVWGESDLGIGLVNHVVPAGASIKVSSSALDSLYFTVTGVELS